MTAPRDKSETRSVPIGRVPVTVEDVVDLAAGRARAVIDVDETVRRRIHDSAAMVDSALRDGRIVYGITTGYGASAAFEVTPDVAAAMPLNLVRYHGCGTGNPLHPEHSAAVVAVRVVSLARGASGVRLDVLERLCGLLERRVLPVIPEEGSVGASGDLTPLSYVAAVLVGEREAWSGERIVPAAAALEEAGLTPIELRPKEGLAILNGTTVMAALGCVAWDRARRLARLACIETAMASDVLRGPEGHFDDRIFELKPHPGQRTAAAWIREHLARREAAPDRLQDPYSIRCAPHVIGVLMDALPFTRQLLETEVNGVNDNPLLDSETGRVLHGGNFYGGHACLATDTLKNVVANLADLLDRQMVLLVNPASNAGLPANLVARTGPDRFTHHGFKGMEITASALTAEALKLASPASVFSRSTESHNQDKVSMGTISARESLRICELVERVAAIHLLALCQAIDLRGPDECGEPSRRMWQAVRARVAVNDGDRRMDRDIETVLGMHRGGELPVGDATWG